MKRQAAGEAFFFKQSSGQFPGRGEAPHFESSLLILVVAACPSSGFDFAAQVWRVEPGAKEVETLEV